MPESSPPVHRSDAFYMLVVGLPCIVLTAVSLTVILTREPAREAAQVAPNVVQAPATLAPRAAVQPASAPRVAVAEITPARVEAPATRPPPAPSSRRPPRRPPPDKDLRVDLSAP
jgi:hypothetical protein